jgi:Raf kinase inhibitor-like YbhB/YbcL family protein
MRNTFRVLCKKPDIRTACEDPDNKKNPLQELWIHRELLYIEGNNPTIMAQLENDILITAILMLVITSGLLIAGCTSTTTSSGMTPQTTVSPTPQMTVQTTAVTQTSTLTQESTNTPVPAEISLTSNAFLDNESIPSRYTCDGQDVSPQLSWNNVPPGTRSLMLIVEDHDAPGFTHWRIFNIPPTIRELSEDVQKSQTLPGGIVQGTNGFGAIGYRGPCPPGGTAHRYFFTLYALDTEPNLSWGTTKKDIAGHVIGTAEIMGTYKRV